MSDGLIEALITRLAEAEVEFIIVGGTAAVLHGAPLVTKDLDIVHRRTPENIERLLAVLRTVDAIKRADSRQLRPTSSWFLGRGHILLDTKDGPLDVLCEFEPGEDYDWLAPRSVRIAQGSRSILVVDLPTLIELKTRAGRPKDRMALPILVATLEEQTRGAKLPP